MMCWAIAVMNVVVVLFVDNSVNVDYYFVFYFLLYITDPEI